MKTKYILHGGACNRESEGNKKFYQEILESVEQENLNILCVYFARPSSRWVESFLEDKRILLTLNKDKKISIKLAQLDDFDKQILDADIIFLGGGKDGCLKEELLKVDTKNLFQGKIIVGVSAGANMLTRYYFSSVANDVREGIGILPIKLFTHYSDDKQNEYELLKNHKENIPIYKIEEEKFLVLEVE